MQVTREIKHRVCKVYEFKSEKSNYNEAVDNQVFELPDKS